MDLVRRSILRLDAPPDALDERALRLNLSFVLHDHSASDTVIRTARMSQRHARNITRIPWHTLHVLEPSPVPGPTGTVLTAHIGAPAAFSTLFTRRHPGATLLFTDYASPPLQTVTLFRAEAAIALPTSDQEQLYVAALIMRPGFASAQIVWYGPFRWPDERPAILRSLERLIQAFVEQWMPPSALWRSPAQDLLPGEIREPR